ncbi:recombinase RecT [Blastococcus sp. CT_GayMR16]|uniref:recombinase RecT n=1 Tax=Blastococcus sp. CT_GayMR16 TaxID=2559607 RepID=UPI0010743E4B|nr:recombinase RecT [Blastococcus sp. CT_GayMR16]TFV91378.1 recombinase RecT [Blastococcus sp. CT_GayMR16]
MTQTVSSALATQETSASAMVEQYRDDFAAVLPTHIRPDTWVRLAVGALRRDVELKKAAENDPYSLMAALLHAARLGLEPGTEEYYLTPRREKGQLKVLGIPGYQGLVDLMYRAGVAQSVVVEVVYADDLFIWTPGKVDDQTPPRWAGAMERPYHDINWDAEDRGALRLAYAYAVMRGGAISKVVVLNKAAITKIKQSSQGSDSPYSPWVKHEPSMWLKSAARQLAKWVPTSPERVGVAPVKVASERPTPSGALPAPPPGIDESDPVPHANPETGEVVDAEVVDDPPAGEKATTRQLQKIVLLLNDHGRESDEQQREYLSERVGRRLASRKDLLRTEAAVIIDALEELAPPAGGTR